MQFSVFTNRYSVQHGAALMLASLNGHLNIIKILAENGAAEEGKTLTEIPAEHGDVDYEHNEIAEIGRDNDRSSASEEVWVDFETDVHLETHTQLVSALEQHKQPERPKPNPNSRDGHLLAEQSDHHNIGACGCCNLCTRNYMVTAGDSDFGRLQMIRLDSKNSLRNVQMGGPDEEGGRAVGRACAASYPWVRHGHNNSLASERGPWGANTERPRAQCDMPPVHELTVADRRAKRTR
ncbi:hypothetical protein FIBSPDRAFT_893075 [Athelia psychrophila]|uniref:Ankyrin n=1 Tax=Athelia psychrophila TaxID=1759441 RepID=A0A166HP94_9AGAM|nr:hypothetical protein FIBSPDRAFT_893075 [Fibularhizoctonia sp. CBS 109695]